MWIVQELLQAVPEMGVPKRGRPLVYTDAVIQMLLGLKQVFRLPLRALQGFAGSYGRVITWGLTTIAAPSPQANQPGSLWRTAILRVTASNQRSIIAFS